MPTLDWIGKKAVVNHCKEVPFHLLKFDPDLYGSDRVYDPLADIYSNDIRSKGAFVFLLLYPSPA